jgi:hypothetical protein
MKLVPAIAIALLTSTLCVAQTDAENRAATSIPKLPSLIALSALLMDSAVLQTPTNVKPSNGGMIVYRIAVDDHGKLLRSEPTTRIQDLQPAADQAIKA